MRPFQGRILEQLRSVGVAKRSPPAIDFNPFGVSGDYLITVISRVVVL